MNKIFFLPLVLSVVLVSCQKNEQTEAEIPTPPVSGRLADPCDMCESSPYDPNCCCVITLIATSTLGPRIELCGTVTLSPIITPCRGFVPPFGCNLPAGPYREVAISSGNDDSHFFCAAQGYVYSVTNTGTGTALLEIKCYSGGIVTSSDTLLLTGGGPAAFMTVDSLCNPVPCP